MVNVEVNYATVKGNIKVVKTFEVKDVITPSATDLAEAKLSCFENGCTHITIIGYNIKKNIEYGK